MRLGSQQRQLGPSYGERRIYFDPGKTYIPFDDASYQNLINGSPTADPKSMHYRRF
jgi:hypothetical protein